MQVLSQSLPVVGQFDQEKALKIVNEVEFHVKNVALLIAAPFIGLVYAMSFPFVSIGMIVYCGIQAYRNRK